MDPNQEKKEKKRVQINVKLRPAFYDVLLCLYFEIRVALHVTS